MKITRDFRSGFLPTKNGIGDSNGNRRAYGGVDDGGWWQVVALLPLLFLGYPPPSISRLSLPLFLFSFSSLVWVFAFSSLKMAMASCLCSSVSPSTMDLMFRPFFFFSGHCRDRCPFFLQMKQAPSFMRRVFSSSVSLPFLCPPSWPVEGVNVFGGDFCLSCLWFLGHCRKASFFHSK